GVVVLGQVLGPDQPRVGRELAQDRPLRPDRADQRGAVVPRIGQAVAEEHGLRIRAVVVAGAMELRHRRRRGQCKRNRQGIADRTGHLLLLMRDAGTPAQPGHYASTAAGGAQVRTGTPPRSLAASVRAGDNRDMDITLNGEPRQLAAPTTISSLLEAEGLA